MGRKVWTLSLVGVLALAGLAGAEGTRKERMQAQVQRLAAIEGRLDPRDQQVLDHHLEAIERVLDRYPAGASLTCLSNGQAGSYERFVPTDPTTGTALGKPTALQTCKQLLAVQSQGLLCVSNGEQGSYERFAVYDLGRQQQRGGLTALKSCQALISHASADFLCHSNGQAGSYEKFHLYNRATDKPLGGDTLLEQCLGSIPN